MSRVSIETSQIVGQMRERMDFNLRTRFVRELYELVVRDNPVAVEVATYTCWQCDSSDVWLGEEVDEVGCHHDHENLSDAGRHLRGELPPRR